MEVLWNSVDKLSRLNTVVLACAAVIGFVAGGFVVVSWFTGTRLAYLQDRALDRYKTDADLRIANANETSAKANERTEELKRETADLTSRNLALEAAIAPRRLTDRQKKGLAQLTVSNRIVGVRSYSSDTEGFILATQIVDALAKARIPIEDNRLTMQPAGSVSLGVAVEGPDKALVDQLRTILSLDGNLMEGSTLGVPNRGFTSVVSFGVVSSGTPLAALITVGVKPIK